MTSRGSVLRTTYRRTTYRIAEADEDRVTTACWMRGCLGLEIKAPPPGVPGFLLIEVYEPLPPARGAEPGENGDIESAERLTSDVIEDADWMASYREHVQPFSVGRRFLLDPREPQSLGDRTLDGRIWLRLPARSAFGTGSHESTRLALELLERADVQGRRVLDVGTGTGILAFAAVALGARLAVGFDNDFIAPLHAAVNARLNGIRAALFAGTLDALGSRHAFDVALVNVVPEQILPELDALVARLAPGATAIFSGILRTAGPGFLRALRTRGMVRRASRSAGEWVAYRTELVPR